MDELTNLLKQIFGDYNGTVVLAILLVVKYVWPFFKKYLEDAAKREDTIIRILKRGNILMKADLECLKAAGIQCEIPEISEDDL